MATTLKQQAKVRTNTTPQSVCAIQVTPIQFANLWAAYPKERDPYRDAKGKVPAGFDNQCAIRVSSALHHVGVTMKSFKGAAVQLDGQRAAIRAEEFATWLKLQPFCGLPSKPHNITGPDWQQKIKGKTGIIFFKDYWSRDGEVSHASGDHVDLWNKDRLTPGFASFMRFTLGLNASSILGFSDLGKAKEILFWEVK
ncbi:type VI secretion system amidase effector protein Tae4 [Aquabacterium sp. CECT 9606]|uniref:type VI secretion system amidase effector protein Tae4 n=1 Tax=Aquabacterium sp. CECT 9606 TaxID=2845822 RepID=UPI001E5E0239|nr:type VI secretion system amidase effector protein Tae4 [Aquabacterium sp. CECT 9606]CAH0354231.1 hypothetical protein AQB9606_03611 [Aquabacterium sp. CECT 9606]